MKANIECDLCKYSLDELEQFRDKDGFIDLSKAGIKFSEKSREKVGNQDRIKNWVNFNGTKCLIKGEAILNTERNYGVYSELIVEEIGKTLGIQMAHYDLIKMLDDNKKYIFGVLSVSMINDDEVLISLRDIIGDEPYEQSKFADTTTYEFAINGLEEKLYSYGYSKDNIEHIVREFKKRMAFCIAVLETDKHVENFSFIKKVDNNDILDLEGGLSLSNIIKNDCTKGDAYTIHLSPNYDSEASLLLDNDISTVSSILEDFSALKMATNIAEPRIGTIKRIDEGGLESIWMDTLEALIEDDEVYEYCNSKLRNMVNMDEVLCRVEDRIGALLPEPVKLIAKYAYQCRHREFLTLI